MVAAAVPDFIAHGLDEAHCFSDAFTPQGGASAPAASVSARPQQASP
jgi:hypothetical protein